MYFICINSKFKLGYFLSFYGGSLKNLIFLGWAGTETKRGRGVGQFSYLSGGLVKKMGYSLPHFGRQGASHDITEPADSQKNIIFSENDCMTAEILEKPLSNEWLQTQDLREQGSI